MCVCMYTPGKEDGSRRLSKLRLSVSVLVLFCTETLRNDSTF